MFHDHPQKLGLVSKYQFADQKLVVVSLILNTHRQD